MVVISSRETSAFPANLKLGLLANFALDKAITHRVPRLPVEVSLDEDYDHIADLIRKEHKPAMRIIRDGLLEIYHTIGLGDTATTYRNLAIVELHERGLTVLPDLIVEPVFHECRLPRSPISPLLVNNMVCLQVEAINDEVSARLIRTMQTHLRWTGIPFGIVVTFGRRKLSIRGLGNMAFILVHSAAAARLAWVRSIGQVGTESQPVYRPPACCGVQRTPVWVSGHSHFGPGTWFA